MSLSLYEALNYKYILSKRGVMEQNQNNQEVNTPQYNEVQQGGQQYGNPNPQYIYQNGAQPQPNFATKPDSCLVWAILTTLFCCLPFGIVAIVKAAQVDTLWSAGRHNEAFGASKAARNWSIAAAAVGFIGMAIYIAYVVIMLAVFDEIDFGDYMDY